YKLQRKSALRKFEATHQDLERIQDVLTEVETKVHGLSLQLKRYKRHAKLQEQLKSKDVALAYLRLTALEGQLQPLQEKIQEFQGLKTSGSDTQSRWEKELAKVRAERERVEADWLSEQNRLAALQEQRQTMEQNLLVWREQTRAHVQTLSRLRDEDHRNTQREEKLRQLMEQYTAEIETVEPRREEKLRVLESHKARYDQIETEFRETRQQEESLQSRRWEIQKSLNAKQSLLSRTETLLEEKTAQWEEAQRRHQELMEREESVRRSYEQAVEKATTLRSRLESAEAELQQLRSKREGDQERAQQLNREIVRWESRIETLQSQQTYFEDLITSGEGHPSGVQFILQRARQFPAVLGVLGEMVSIDSSLAPALNAALGDLTHYLVVRSTAEARNMLSVLRREGQREAGILTLDTVPSHPRQEEREAASLLTHVSYPPELKNLLSFLLGPFRLIPSLDELGPDQIAPDCIYVDPSGALWDGRSRWFVSGTLEEGAVLGRKNRLERITAELEEAHQQLATLRVEEEKLKIRLQNQQEDLDAQEAAVSELQSAYQEAQEACLKGELEAGRSRELVAEAERMTASLQEEMESLTASREALQPELKQIEEEMQTFLDRLEDLQTALQQVRERRDRMGQQVQDLRIELIQLENQRESIQLQRRSAQESLDELQRRREQMEAEQQQLNHEIRELEEQVEETSTRLESVKEQCVQCRTRVEEVESHRRALEAKMDSLRDLIQGEQEAREKVLEELRQAEREAAEYLQKIEIIREHVRDQYNLEIPTQMEVSESEDQLVAELERIRRSIENIGPVNMAVQAEYEEEHARYEMLVQQRDDLIEAEANLRETIQRIDRVARKQFLDTFDQIKANYERLFPIFFNGGKGTLSLVGDPDPLESDIAITALPPGKRNQSLRLLSAGEKSLTAIALLFAIYQYKPSPYCILDEVDAPLDDENVQKFLHVLNTFSPETQFIVVTHNKKTMEGAHILYGVTMEKKGVSKIVSVNLD
ncbi:MAG: chromosome segregation protein SMC, partial [Candidatus Neomarinimicrobiota bacterium]